ncbi:MAG: ATP synthase F1 subunit gamma [Tepidisphaeraceae bacterium]
MAKARAIVKRRKAVRNIRKITKTMQMIATAKFQKSLKRAVGSKPYTAKMRELVRELALQVGPNVKHSLLRQPEKSAPGTLAKTGKIAIVVITSNRGLAGGYNGNVLRMGYRFIREHVEKGAPIDVYMSGKKGIAYLKFQKVPIAREILVSDPPRFSEVEPVAQDFIDQFSRGELDAVFVAFMNFISTGMQKPVVHALLPLSGVVDVADSLAREVAEKAAQVDAGALDARRSGAEVRLDEVQGIGQTLYDFMPSATELLDELLPLAVKMALFQAFLDAATSEHVARMVSMKSATDNADKIQKSLTMKYNRARQSQITTELSEIMGGVEAMKGS